MKIGKWVPMGDVVTDAIGGTQASVENILSKACLDTLLAEFTEVCDCDNSHDA
jgi:hypothetical protein